jgi:hypothetical protein
MPKAFVDVEASGEAASLGNAEWLALLLEREAFLRHDKRLATRCAIPICISRPMSRMSITALPAVRDIFDPRDVAVSIETK